MSYMNLTDTDTEPFATELKEVFNYVVKSMSEMNRLNDIQHICSVVERYNEVIK